MNAPLVQEVNTKVLKLAPESAWVVGESFDEQAWLDVAAQTTDGIRQVRGLVLDLAVRGMLVQQDPRDETASRLLERIDGSRSKQGDGEVEARFPIPTSWVWSTLGRVCSYIQRGKSPTYADDSDVLVVSQKCVQWEGFLLDRARFVDPNSLAAYAEERFLRPGDLLWNSTGHGTVGRVAVYVRSSKYSKVVADSHVTVLRPARMEPRFIWCWLASPSVQRTIDDLVSGTTKQTELSTSTVVAHAVPVPPLAEQKRIVAKVDDLMRMLDDLEAKQTKRRETQARLRSAVLAALATAKGPEEFTTAWTRAAQNFAVLFDSGDSVAMLRQLVRDLAVRGRLLTRTRREECERAASSDGLFEIPGGWRWLPLGEISIRTDYGTSQKAHVERRGVPVLRMNNIQDGKLSVDSLKYVASDTEGLANLMLAPGDLLFNRTNSYELVGKMAVFREVGPYTFASYLIRVRLRDDVVPEYVNIYFGSRVCREMQIEPHITRQTNQANFNGTKLKGIEIPLPPVEEQELIVAKVKQLMMLCDTLEAKLRRMETTASKLVEALVAEMVA